MCHSNTKIKTMGRKQTGLTGFYYNIYRGGHKTLKLF